MLGDEHRRSRVYASCLDVLRTVPTCSLWFRGFKDKNTMRGCIQGSKITNKLQRKYLEVKKQETTYDSQVPAQNATINVPLMFLENEIKEVRDG